MADIREIVKARLEELDMSTNQLATDERLTCGRDAVFRWLSGKTELGAVHVGEVFRALGLDVYAAEGEA